MVTAKLVDIPVVDLKDFLDGGGSLDHCRRLASSLKSYSAVVVRDPRVGFEHSEEFLDQMEAYFAQTDEVKLRDSRPDVNYQVGVCPEYTEVPRNHEERIRELEGENKPVLPSGADAKWRFFWRIGERPPSTAFPELNAEPVIPEGFPSWAKVMNGWGYQLLSTIITVAEMLAIGLDLPKKSILERLMDGPHLLAPTGSDLVKHGKLETVFAGLHYDLNALTIHGASRYPGLHLWTPDGLKFCCSVPPGCLLVQAGIQLEYFTAGEIQRGFHEVIVNEKTLDAVATKREQGRILWRVSSTMFAHVASDQTLEPLGHFKESENVAKYQPILAGDQVLEELQIINLAKS